MCNCKSLDRFIEWGENDEMTFTCRKCGEVIPPPNFNAPPKESPEITAELLIAALEKLKGIINE